jgi:enoyl-CoA hydratase/carnithine racemase
MTELVRYEATDSIATLTMDDGRVNVMSPAMLRALHHAFDRAERDRSIVVLTGREKIFSAGFDLKVFAEGGAREIYDMMKLGAELALRVLSFPTPVVAACTGHALPMGAFLMLASDVRVGADGPFRIGLNEVAIGLTVPSFALELARQRLIPAYFNRTAMTGELFAPREAVVAGFLDRVVAPEELHDTARAIAAGLTKIDLAAHAATKARARGAAIKAVRAAIDAEIVLEIYQANIARRSAATPARGQAAAS